MRKTVAVATLAALTALTGCGGSDDGESGGKSASAKGGGLDRKRQAAIVAEQSQRYVSDDPGRSAWTCDPDPANARQFVCQVAGGYAHDSSRIGSPSAEVDVTISPAGFMSFASPQAPQGIPGGGPFPKDT